MLQKHEWGAGPARTAVSGTFCNEQTDKLRIN